MTAVPLSLAALSSELGRDPEFLLHARHLTTRIRVVIGEQQSFMIAIRDGELLGIDEVWGLLLQKEPPAFYHDFYPAMVHHGFRIEGDMEMIMAFYPAIRRLGDVLRSVAASEVSA